MELSIPINDPRGFFRDNSDIIPQILADNDLKILEQNTFNKILDSSYENHISYHDGPWKICRNELCELIRESNNEW